MYVKIRARSCQGLIGQMFRTMTLSAEKQPELLQDLRASDPRTVANAFHELPVLDRRPELSRITRRSRCSPSSRRRRMHSCAVRRIDESSLREPAECAPREDRRQPPLHPLGPARTIHRRGRRDDAVSYGPRDSQIALRRTNRRRGRYEPAIRSYLSCRSDVARSRGRAGRCRRSRRPDDQKGGVGGVARRRTSVSTYGCHRPTVSDVPAQWSRLFDFLREEAVLGLIAPARPGSHGDTLGVSPSALGVLSEATFSRLDQTSHEQ